MSTHVAGQRPIVLGDDLRRYWALSWTLATTEYKLRFYGSVLGYAWSLVRPFALFGVLWVVFVKVVHLGAGVPNFAEYILVSMVLFGFFRATADGGLGSLVGRENLLRKMRFPRLVIPTTVVLQALFELGMTLAAVAIFLVLSGVYPSWAWLELIPIIAYLTLFAAGLGLLLSVLFVRFRDIAPIWDVVGQMLLYASPILYVATAVPDKYQDVYLYNPIAAALTQMRHAVVDPSAPTTAELIGGWDAMLIPLGIAMITFVVGVWAFFREAPKAAEHL
jgi:ABC-2 type transport system permease protein